jgi:hypothetical protein
MVLVASAKHFHHAHVPDTHHHLEGARIEEIADEHARRVAEHRVRGPPTPAQLGLVDHVVMEQRRGMDELDHRRQFVKMRAPVAARPGAEQQQRGRRLPCSTM